MVGLEIDLSGARDPRFVTLVVCPLPLTPPPDAQPACDRTALRAVHPDSFRSRGASALLQRSATCLALPRPVPFLVTLLSRPS